MPGLAELILAEEEDEDEAEAKPPARKTGLADLILAEEEEDEDALEDPELAKQIAALQARKAVLLGETAPGAAGAGPAAAPRPQPSAAAAAAPAPAAAAAGAGGAGAGAAGQLSRTRTLGRSQGASLADAILGSGDGAGDPVDRELEAMERELEKQMQDYRQRCEGAGKEPPAFAAPSAAAPARPAAAAGAAAAPAEPGAAPEAAGEELLEMRSLAAKLDEAFPEPGPAEGEEQPAAQPRQQAKPPARLAHREADRAAAPADEDVEELKGALEDLDVRLRALQSRDEMLTAKEDTQHASMALAPEASRAVAEMRAQNQHLRERFSTPGVNGLLKLNRSLFPVSDRPGAGEAIFTSLPSGTEAD